MRLRPHIWVPAVLLGLVTACRENASLDVFATASVKPVGLVGVEAKALARLNQPIYTVIRNTGLVDKRGWRGARAGDHEIHIAKGALEAPARFVITEHKGEHVLIELRAFRQDGSEIKAFNEGIRLKLSYKNIAVDDPAKLAVVFLADGQVNGRKLVVPSAVSEEGQIISAQVNYSSFYSIGVKE
jgi:hypothetical protein